MATYNQLGFALVGLKTISFATIESSHKKTGETNLMTGLGFGLDINDHTVTCNAKFSFEKKKNQPFLILEVRALFEIEKNDFFNKMRQEDNSYIITKDLAIHFAVLTVGSARGILHSKTEGTHFNDYILPTIDVKSMLPEDIILKF
tara:strand:+ start:12734 stop:13171 length:438 start_codon:yes stop_codon:yes gene_type:complete